MRWEHGHRETHLTRRSLRPCDRRVSPAELWLWVCLLQMLAGGFLLAVMRMPIRGF